MDYQVKYSKFEFPRHRRLSNLKQCLLSVAYRRVRCVKFYSTGCSERHGLLRICGILASTQMVMYVFNYASQELPHMVPRSFKTMQSTKILPFCKESFVLLAKMYQENVLV